jgi:hypothetical protein
MRKKIITSSFFLCMFVATSFAQETTDSLLNKAKEKVKEKLNVSGTMGVTYEGYGLTRNPSGWTGYQPRRPWNQVRFNFTHLSLVKTSACHLILILPPYQPILQAPMQV